MKRPFEKWILSLAYFVIGEESDEESKVRNYWATISIIGVGFVGCLILSFVRG